MLSALSPPFTPAAAAAQVVDHDLVRQKRLQKFLLNCAKAGVQTPLPLDATQQDNATFDTMLEAAAECEAIGIPPPHRPYASASTLPLPPTPKTGAPNSIWGVFTNDQTSWTPDLPEDDGGDEFPNFPEVFASIINSPEEPKGDNGYENYDPAKDPYCVAYRKGDNKYENYDPTKDPYCVAYEGYDSCEDYDYDTREDESCAYGTY